PHTFQATLAYDGTTLTETITDLTTNATANFTYTVNIPTYVGSSIAYVGFGGGTGGSNSIQKVLTWTFGPGGTQGTALAATSGPPPSDPGVAALDQVLSSYGGGGPSDV